MSHREHEGRMYDAVARAEAALTPARGVRPSGRVGPPLGRVEEVILAHAALAPSGHNTQPWSVRIETPRRWTVAVDAGRRLPAVDPGDRELAISLGAFVENLAAAAAACGLAADVEVPEAAGASALAAVRLAPAAPGDERDLERIRLRRTIRNGHRTAPLRPDDLRAVLEPYGDAAAWFPAGSREARWLAEAALEAFREQTWREEAQRELAGWLRFSRAEIASRLDGLTPATMEVGALAAFALRHLMGRDAALGRRFREGGVETARRQVREGAGWLLVTSRDERPASLVGTGRAFERMALGLRERGLAAHPMSQLLEEEPWRSRVAAELALPGAPQLLLRVGYVGSVPPPVSPRRPPRAFARVG